MATEDKEMAKRPATIKGARHLLPRRDGGQVEILYYAAPQTNAPLLIEVHGGGFMHGHHWDDDNLCDLFRQRLSINVASVEYRYAPEIVFPKATEDVYDALIALLGDPSFDFDRNNVFLTGHSAGGNIVAGIGLLDRGEHHLRGLILNYPFLDCAIDPKERPKIKGSIPVFMMNIFNKKYFPDVNQRGESLASPVLASNDEIRRMPATLIITCGRDNLNIDGARLFRRMTENGIQSRHIEYEKAMHGFVENVPKGTDDRMFWISKAERQQTRQYFERFMDEACGFMKSWTI